MQISTAQHQTLLELARDHWLTAECTLVAYERDYRRHKSNAAWAGRGTMVAAMLSGVAASTLFSGPQFSTVAAISSILTAVLAAFERVYDPAKKSQSFWDCRTQLEGIKRDIVSCAIALENVADMASGMDLLNKISTRLTDVAKLPFDVLPTDRDLALQKAGNSVIASLIARHVPVSQSGSVSQHAPAPLADDDRPAALGFDAPGVVAVSRRPSVAARG